MSRLMAILVCAFLASACGRSTEQDRSEPDARPARATTGYEQALDKARDVEAQVLEAAERQRREIDKLDGG